MSRRGFLSRSLGASVAAAKRGERVLYVSGTPDADRSRVLTLLGRPPGPTRIEFDGGGWLEFNDPTPVGARLGWVEIDEIADFVKGRNG